MNWKLIRSLGLLFAAGAAVPAQADGPLRVDITGGESAPILLAVPTVQAGSTLPGAAVDVGQMLAEIVRADLGGVGVYRMLGDDVRQPASPVPDLVPWRERGAQVLVWGRVSAVNQSTLTYDCSYHDVYSGQREGSITITVMLRDVRRAAHRCADFAFQQTTGDPGHFDTQIAYVRRNGGTGDPLARVAVMDVDGAGSRDIGNGQTLVSFPAISRDARFIAFTAYQANRPQLILHQLGTNQFRAVPVAEGQAYSPSFVAGTPDLLFVVAKDGNSDIYHLNAQTGAIRQLTNSPGSDIAPSASPDGSQIVFESDRSGSQQLYVMNADGTGQRRITFAEGVRFASPAWSPKGDRIAFTRIDADGGRIATMRPDGSDQRVIPGSGQDENPVWGASSRALLFSRTAGGAAVSEIWRTDLSGRRQVRIGSGADSVSYPSWSGARP